MRFSTSITTAATLLLAGASTAFAEKFVVTVGKGDTLRYEPSSVTAKAGDIVEFQFMSKNHTVTQSTFDKPCETKLDGVDSGHQLVPAGTTVFPAWSITVQNDNAPLWFYCNQPPHCARGMVFAINPTAERPFEKFVENAAASAPPAAPAPAGSAPAPAGTGAATPVVTPAGSVIPLTPAAPAATESAPVDGAANAGELPGSTSENLAQGANDNGAVGKVVGWPVVVASVVLGALML